MPHTVHYVVRWPQVAKLLWVMIPNIVLSLNLLTETILGTYSGGLQNGKGYDTSNNNLFFTLNFQRFHFHKFPSRSCFSLEFGNFSPRSRVFSSLATTRCYVCVSYMRPMNLIAPLPVSNPACALEGGMGSAWTSNFWPFFHPHTLGSLYQTAKYT